MCKMNSYNQTKLLLKAEIGIWILKSQTFIRNKKKTDPYENLSIAQLRNLIKKHQWWHIWLDDTYLGDWTTAYPKSESRRQSLFDKFFSSNQLKPKKLDIKTSKDASH